MTSVSVDRHPSLPSRDLRPKGIQDHPGATIPIFRRSATAEADSTALCDTLRTRYRVPEDQLLHQQDATRLALEGAISRFLARVPSGSQLLVYYLGHGYLDEQQAGYLVPQGFRRPPRRFDGIGGSLVDRTGRTSAPPTRRSLSSTRGKSPEPIRPSSKHLPSNWPSRSKRRLVAPFPHRRS